jgi:predicted RNA-binding protein YlqC (UPF0109 family)
MAETIDQQFVEYIVKTLVNNPDKVKVDRTIDERGVLLTLDVDPEDIGRVIGKRGATAQSMRTLLRALGTKNGARYNLKIVNNDDYTPQHDRDGREDKPTDVAGDDSFAEENDNNESEAPVENPTDTAVENSADDLAKKTREELADMDDLDI